MSQDHRTSRGLLNKYFDYSSDGTPWLSRPTKLDLNVGKIIDIAAGGTICMILNEEHDVFVWGYGILGKGPNLEQSIHPTLKEYYSCYI